MLSWLCAHLRNCHPSWPFAVLPGMLSIASSCVTASAAHLSKPKEAQGSSVAGTCARLIDAIVALGSSATKGMWDVPGVGTTAVGKCHWL